ncbi:hypothetical protein BDR26DRAFT_865857 [Obelidium mucronatum]|nr:hypothetical protein BDR26DRAFT_865857 [Obelidium mucronatum]
MLHLLVEAADVSESRSVSPQQTLESAGLPAAPFSPQSPVQPINSIAVKPSSPQAGGSGCVGGGLPLDYRHSIYALDSSNTNERNQEDSQWSMSLPHRPTASRILHVERLPTGMGNGQTSSGDNQPIKLPPLFESPNSQVLPIHKLPPIAAPSFLQDFQTESSTTLPSRFVIPIPAEKPQTTNHLQQQQQQQHSHESLHQQQSLQHQQQQIQQQSYNLDQCSNPSQQYFDSYSSNGSPSAAPYTNNITTGQRYHPYQPQQKQFFAQPLSNNEDFGFEPYFVQAPDQAPTNSYQSQHLNERPTNQQVNRLQREISEAHVYQQTHPDHPYQHKPTIPPFYQPLVDQQQFLHHQQQQFQAHQAQRQIPASSKTFQCTEPGCDKIFYRKHHLVSHLVSHTEGKPFKCPRPNCEGTFRRNQDLRRHLRNVKHDD